MLRVGPRRKLHEVRLRMMAFKSHHYADLRRGPPPHNMVRNQLKECETGPCSTKHTSDIGLAKFSSHSHQAVVL